MSDERIEVEKREEPVVNKDRKKKKRIVAIIIATIVLLAVGIAVICVAKYRAEHRYIPFEELEAEQIILIQEMLRFEGDERVVYIRAVDVTGDIHFLTLPYKEWGEIEEYFDEISSAEKENNHIKDEDMKQIYEHIVQINKDAEFYCIMNSVPTVEPPIYSQGYLYAIRYKRDGSAEYIKFWEETSWCVWYLMSDSAAKEIYKIVDSEL